MVKFDSWKPLKLDFYVLLRFCSSEVVEHLPLSKQLCYHIKSSYIKHLFYLRSISYCGGGSKSLESDVILAIAASELVFGNVVADLLFASSIFWFF